MIRTAVIRAWLEKYREYDQYTLASASRRDPFIAEVEEYGCEIDNLVGTARIVKRGLAAKEFELRFNAELAAATEDQEGADAIWGAA